MKETKRAKLKAAGWRVGSPADFLHLSPEEITFIEMKLALAQSIRLRRKRRKLTQAQLAKLLNSSQSRVAKMEAADTSVSLDLLIRSLLTLGASPRDVARIISSPASKAA